MEVVSFVKKSRESGRLGGEKDRVPLLCSPGITSREEEGRPAGLSGSSLQCCWSGRKGEWRRSTQCWCNSLRVEEGWRWIKSYPPKVLTVTYIRQAVRHSRMWRPGWLIRIRGGAGGWPWLGPGAGSSASNWLQIPQSTSERWVKLYRACQMSV